MEETSCGASWSIVGGATSLLAVMGVHVVCGVKVACGGVPEVCGGVRAACGVCAACGGVAGGTVSSADVASHFVTS